MRILIVKKDQNTAQALRNKLFETAEKLYPDSKVAFCCSQASAMEYLRKYEFDAIVSGDHLKDRGTGQDIYNAIRSRDGYKKTPIVIYSPDPDAKARVRQLNTQVPPDPFVYHVSANEHGETEIFQCLRRGLNLPATRARTPALAST